MFTKIKLLWAYGILLLLPAYSALAQESAPIGNSFSQTGFYAGFGTGVNVTANYGLIKTYEQNNQIQAANMGDITGYSTPIFLYGGYRFNPYLSAELTYTYSGNQEYPQPNGCQDCTNFWGSQNYFGFNAVGYLPVADWFYLKARAGLAVGGSTMTTYVGNPGTVDTTSILGVGIDYPLTRHLAINFDYINYGLLIPIKLQYRTPPGGQSLGTVDTLQQNLLLFSLKIDF